MIAVLYDLIYIFPVSLISVLAANIFIYVPQKSAYPFILLTVVFAVCLCIVHWKSRLRFFTPLILILFAVTAILVHKADDRVEFMFENRWVLWISLIVIGCFIAGKILLIHRWGRRVMAAVIVSTLLFCVWQEITVDKAVTAIAFLPVLLMLAEEVQSKWKKSGYMDGRSHLVGISPFLILICLLVFLMPASEEPYSWKMVLKIVEKASEGIELTSRFFHSGDEDYHAKTGFEMGDSLVSEVSEDSKEVIRMTSLKPSDNVIYLVGGVCDSFDGRAWSAAHTPDSREHMMDILETAACVANRDSDNFSDFLRKYDTTLYYLDFNTSHVFMPAKTLFAGNSLGGIELTAEDGCFKSVKTLGYSSSYSVSFYRMNLGNEKYRELMEDPEVIDEKVWDEVRRNRVPESGYQRGEREIYDTSYASYLEYQDEMYEIYLPKTEVSNKTGQYLEKLMEGAESDYEKLSRIEQMLGEMDYDLKPGRIPDDVETQADYLDHLLFNSQKGFCTHYATAFVLLARAEGIPARLVQGFYVRGRNTKEVVVTGAMAHSWAEAYIKGVGWVTFEPTPGKKVIDSWNVDSAGGSAAIAGPSSDLSYMPDIEEEEVHTEEESKPFVTTERVEVILIPIAIFILLLVIFVLLEDRIERRWYRKLGETDKFKITGRRNLKILEYLGYARGEGETLSELAKRAGKTVDPEFLRFIAYYERMLYGEKDPVIDQIRSAELANRDLLEILKEEKGKLFFLYRMRIMHPEKIKQ